MFDFMSTKQRLEIIKTALLKIYTREEGPEASNKKPIHRKIMEIGTSLAVKRFSSQYKGAEFFAERNIEEEQVIERE